MEKEAVRNMEDEDLAVDLVLHRRSMSEVRAYYAGARISTRMWAHWKDGVQYVGTTGTTLAEALRSLDMGEELTLERIYQEEQKEIETQQIIAQRQERE